MFPAAAAAAVVAAAASQRLDRPIDPSPVPHPSPPMLIQSDRFMQENTEPSPPASSKDQPLHNLHSLHDFLPPHPIQSVYNACKSAFLHSTPPFPPDSLNAIRSLLDNIKPSDVGLDEAFIKQRFRNSVLLKSTTNRQGKGISPISYIHIFECKDFSMGVFCLPPSAVMPLHDHPGMTVLSKLLFGSMHVKAYDWANDSNLTRSKPLSRLAKLVTDKVMSAPCEATVLYPTSGGNLHEFRADTTCAILDILAPPYSEEDRNCTYYKATPCASHPGALSRSKKKNTRRNYAWLEVIQRPLDCVVQFVPYEGPEVLP